MESQLALANAKIESLERECVNLSKNQDKLKGQQNKKELKLQLKLAKAKLECLEKEFLKLSKNQDRHEGEQSLQAKNLKQAFTKIGNIEMDIIEMYKELEKRKGQEKQARLMLEKQVEELRNEMARRDSEERLKATSRQAMDNLSVVASDWPVLQKIQPFFVFQVHPQNVLPIIHKYDTKVLTQQDIQAVQCVTQNHGSIQGASELLSRIVRYECWHSCLINVLRDSKVQLNHVADEIEKILDQLGKGPAMPGSGRRGNSSPSPSYYEQTTYGRQHSSDIQGVTGIKNTDNERDFAERSLQDKEMPGGKIPHPWEQKKSKRYFCAEDEGKVKNGQRNNSARLGEETARDDKKQTVPAGSKKEHKLERKSDDASGTATEDRAYHNPGPRGQSPSNTRSNLQGNSSPSPSYYEQTTYGRQHSSDLRGELGASQAECLRHEDSNGHEYVQSALDELFEKCSLTLSKEISSRKDDELLTAIAVELKFKITDYASLTIEKENVTERDMSRLTKLLKAKLEPRLGDDYEIIISEKDEVSHQVPESDATEKSYQAVKKEVSESLESLSLRHKDRDDALFEKCSLTLSKEISSRKDDELLTAIAVELKFKITGYADLTIEKENVTERDISRLIKLLNSKLKPRLDDDYEIVNSENDEVCHYVPESDGAKKSHQAVKKEGSESLESFDQISGHSNVTEESQSPEKIRNALKDSVAPQPANSQDEYDTLNNMFMRSLSLSESQTGDSSSRSTSQIMTGMDHQNLPANLEPTSSEEKRKYGKSMGDEESFKEQGRKSEDMNHIRSEGGSGSVSDKNYAHMKDNSLYSQSTSERQRSIKECGQPENETEDRNKVERKARDREAGDTRSHEKPRVRKEQSDDKEIKRQDTLDSDQSESNEVETCIEYIMKKTHYRLAKQYFEGCLEEQYLSKAQNTDEGYLFSLCSNDTNDILFLKVLRKLKFEIVGHAKDDTPKVKLIADQLKCKDLNVKVIEHGSKSFLVGPREKVAEVKQRIISKLQENEEAANSFDTPENSVRQRSQPSMRDDMNSFSKSSDGDTRHQSLIGVPTVPGNVRLSSVTGATANSVEKDTVYQLGGLQLCISSRPALSIQSDSVITIGEDFDKLSGIPDYSVKTHKRPCEDVPSKKRICYTFSFVHKPDGKYRQLLCRLFPDPKSQSELSSAFENLDAAIRLAAVRGDKVKDVKSFVLTSSVLYADPSNKKHKPPNIIDRKLVGNFGKLVFDYVEKLSTDSNCKIKKVVVTASEDVSIQLCKIMETRPVIKNVGASARGAYPHPRPRGQSPARWGPGSRVGSTSSFSPGWTRTSYGQPSSAYHNSGLRGQSPAMSGSDYQGSSSSTTLSSSSGQTKYDRQHSSGDSKREPSSLGGMASLGATDHGSSSGSPVDQWLVCGICTFVKRTVKNTSCCGILLCSDCSDRVAACPYCRKPWRIRTGDQPRGYMTVSYTRESADGYGSKGSWKIEYFFPAGTQTAEHPNPGKQYDSTRRTAYVPATEDSMDILKLLRLAFIRRLTFTVGVSRTTGEDNKITWNDIHHKTKLQGGNFGFPDATYFTRVIQELRAKGVTLASMTETEISSIGVFEERLNSYSHYFSDYTSSVYSSV